MKTDNSVSTLEIEVAIMGEFDYRANLIVPNITDQMGSLAFETDMLVLTKSGYAYGFEIKVSKSDLKADFKKKHHAQFDIVRNGKMGLERFYSKFKHFSYAVPSELREAAISLIPDFCGLYVFEKATYKLICIREPKKLFDYKTLH